MSLWGTNSKRVTTGTVYCFSRIKIENWPRNATHRHLQLLRETQVVPRGELAEIFSEIAYSDTTLTGTCVGFEDILVYSSCVVCKKRQSGDACGPCKANVITNDFKVRGCNLSIYT